MTVPKFRYSTATSHHVRSTHINTTSSLFLLIVCLLLLLILNVAQTVNCIVINKNNNKFKDIEHPLISIEQLTRNRRVTVSGISSGAVMAVQLHVAFSSIIKGAGIVAGTPYYCAQNNVALALTTCMTDPDLIIVPELVAITKNTAAFGYIDDPSQNLKDSRVLLFSGTEDETLKTGVVRKTAEYYEHFVQNSSENIVQIYNVSAAHAWVTDLYGNSCNYLGSPYINNCGIDIPGKILEHVLNSKLNARVKGDLNNLYSYDQKKYVPFSFFTMKRLGLMDTGFIYIPKPCLRSDSNCSLHVALHGCMQNTNLIGESFATESGLNEWAETNNIIVLYPQARANTLNPKGCWDWWGYSGMQYASNLGYQMKTIKNLIDAITSSK